MIVMPRTLPEPTPVRSECPLCHSTDALMLYPVTSAQAVEHVLRHATPADALRLREHVESLWHGDRCEFVRCGRCTLEYAVPFTPGDATFYEQVYRDESEYTGWRWEFDVTREALRRLIGGTTDAPRVLEIGAGDGAFVRGIAPEVLPKDRLECTEHSAYGRGEIEGYGVTCHAGDIRQADVARGGPFDVVCMFQVLEHLGDLDGLFGDLSRITTENAHAFIGVPNAACRDAFAALGFVEDVPPTHISRWNRECFDVAAKLHGWRVADYAVEPVDRAALLKKYAWFRYEASRPARRLNALQPGMARRLLKTTVTVGLLCASPWPTVLRLLAPAMGTVQWVHLVRDGSVGANSPAGPAARTLSNEGA